MMMEMNVGLTSNEMQSSPKVQIIEDGVEITDPNRIRPDVMQFVMLAKIARETTKIRQYFDDITPDGNIINYVLQVTDVRQRVVITIPAQSVAFMNDGPDSVAIWINEPTDLPKTIAHNETYDVDFDVHKLFGFYIQCNTGEHAQLRAAVLS